MSKGAQDNLLSGKSSTNLSLFCCETTTSSGPSGSTFTTPIITTDTTQSTNDSTGSLILDGGAGIAKDVYIGGNLTVTGSITGGSTGSAFTTPVTTTDTTDSTSTATGSIITAGGIGIAKSVYMGGKLHVTDSTQSTTINTGCIQATGGVGIVKNLHVGGTVHVTDTTNTTTGLDGSLFTNGGLGVAKSLYVAGLTASSSHTTGALIVTGGAGIGGDVQMQTGGKLVTNSIQGGNSGSFYLTGSDFSSLYSYDAPTVQVVMGQANNDYLISDSTSTQLLAPAGGYIQFANGSVGVTDTTEAGVGIGSVVANGGIYVAKKILNNSTTEATSTDGAIRTAGGISAAKKIYAVGQIKTDDTTDSSSTTTGSIVAAGGLGVAGNVFIGTTSKTITTVSNEIRKGTGTISGASFNFPVSINANESIDYRISLSCSTAPVWLDIFANTSNTLLDPKTSLANGVACLSGAVANHLTYAQVNMEIQTFTITIARNASYYLFYMNGVMFLQAGTAHACTFAAYYNAAMTGFSLTPSAGTISGYYRWSKYTA
jgi:hypothetical protein